MHSNGHGEESPEPYRGVVLPSSQNQPQTYGDQVQPASGTPWGAPPAGSHPHGPVAGQPVPAEATQMLPPYPGGMPAPGAQHQPGPVPPAMPPHPAPGAPAMPPHPAGPPPAAPPLGGPAGPAPAEATQMLPPYPGGVPGRPPAAAPMPPVAQPPAMPPAMPAAPPMAPQAAQPPQQPFPGAQPQQPHQPPAEQPVEATQAMPLSIFHEQQPYDGGYDAAPQGPYAQGQPQQGQAPGYGPGAGQPHDEQADYGGGQDLGGDYDHLFRSDVPSPAPSQPHIIQPDRIPGTASYAQGPQQGYPPQGHDAYPPQGYDGQYGYEDDDHGGRRKMSPKVVIGIVVAGCVVAGLVVGGLLNSGGKASADNAGDGHTTAPGTPGSASPGDTPRADDAGKQQAQALDALLKTSGNSRTAVVNAVESIKNCKNLPGAASDLRSAAGQRNGLVTQLGTLSVDKLAGHADLTDALTKAWHASAAADAHYAAWADQVAHNHKLCKGGHAHSTNEVQTANRESGTATEQKKRAVRLWNHIAETYGLTKRQYSQL